MTNTLEDTYPEAAPYIEDAVAEHGEAWVLEHYYEKLYPLSVVVAMPEKEELPFYDDAVHDTLTKSEQTEMYQAWSEYRENLRKNTQSTE
ncbi:hypothetical protein [Haloferax sp. YSSS75]|uniref:hypothetical protein n=1 Tax=Haloferax sp. YSSS75 TaxID=3388564 RepID=UPI00398D563B